ncbi:MAG: TRAP transporter small permease [bacterium]|nr:TRAP transporter small permease [bacterium]
MNTYKKIMHGVVKVENAIMAVTLIVSLVLTFANVIGRKLINHSLTWVDELVVAFFVLISLMGAALACREDGGLVGLSLVSDRLKGPAKMVQKLVANVFSIIYCVILTWQGVGRAASEFTQNAHTYVLHWPSWIFWAFVPVCGVFLVLHFIENTLDFVKARKEGNE